jgi:hypothetical protein
VYKQIMQVRGLISFWLLFTVLLTPVLGLAMCATADTVAKTSCGQCAAKDQASGMDIEHRGSTPASVPAAPCCKRNTPAQALNETAAQIVAPVLLATVLAVNPEPMLEAVPLLQLGRVATPPPGTSPLSLLCTLLI